MVVSASGLMRCWPVRNLPHSPEDAIHPPAHEAQDEPPSQGYVSRKTCRRSSSKGHELFPWPRQLG